MKNGSNEENPVIRDFFVLDSVAQYIPEFAVSIRCVQITKRF